jgi:hypothetical protein
MIMEPYRKQARTIQVKMPPQQLLIMPTPKKLRLIQK